MVYKWKTNFYKTPAEIAGKELERIASLPGGLTAEAVVDESRPVTAPLHNEFEWNNDVAAEKYREQQARSMISNLVYVTEQPEEPVCVAVRAFVKTETEYKNIHIAMNNENDRQYVLKTALRELESFKQKYASITAFDKLFVEIDNLQQLTLGETY